MLSTVVKLSSLALVAVDGVVTAGAVVEGAVLCAVVKSSSPVLTLAVSVAVDAATDAVAVMPSTVVSTVSKFSWLVLAGADVA